MSDLGPCRVVDGVGRNAKGYGRCGVKRFGVIVRYRHRLAWIDAHGCLPPAETPFILHRCDNPPCEDPGHLYAGTAADNSADMMRRGRWRTGYHPSPRLSDDQVAAVRAWADSLMRR